MNKINLDNSFYLEVLSNDTNNKDVSNIEEYFY